MRAESHREKQANDAVGDARKRYRALRQSAYEEAGSSAHVSYPVPDGDGGAMFFSYRRLYDNRCRVTACFCLRPNGSVQVYDTEAVFGCGHGGIDALEKETRLNRIAHGRGHHVDRLASEYAACTYGGDDALKRYATAIAAAEPGDLLPYYSRLGLPIPLQGEGRASS